MPIHLTCHSAYSLQEGLATPFELVQATLEYGMSALGLTDHNLLTGSIEFVTACRDADIHPILGLEIEFGESSPRSGIMEMDTERGEPYLRVERVALVKS